MEKVEVVKEIKKVLTALPRQEVKTPLSFFFRVVLYVTVVVVATIIWGQPAVQKLVFLAGMGVVVCVLLTVIIFAWWRPKNLTYGETGHRAEAKLAFGTEKKELTSAEVALLPGAKKPLEITAGGEGS